MEAPTTINVEVTRAYAHAMADGPLTSGMVGVPVVFECGPEWEGLKKTAVFTAGAVTRDRVDIGNSTTVPADVLATASRRLRIGVYGYTDDGTIVIPTVMADAGMILPGAKPSDDPGTDPELPIWAQLQADIDSLRQSGTVTDEQIAKAVGDYMAEHGSDSDQNANKTLTFTGAVSATYDGTEEVTVNIPEGGSGVGLNSAATELLLVLLQNVSYQNDQSANLAAFAEALGESELPDAGVESWDYVWDYTDGRSLTSSGWTPSINTNQETSFDSENGQYVGRKSDGAVHYLYESIFTNYNFVTAESAVMELVVNCVTMPTANSIPFGLRFCLSNGTTAAVAGLMMDTFQASRDTGDTFGYIETGVDYKVRLEYTADRFTVFVNDAEVKSDVTDESFNYNMGRLKNYISLYGEGAYYIKSVKYREVSA